MLSQTHVATGGEEQNMRGRPFVQQWRDDDTEEVLKAAYLAERDGVIRSRLHALWLLRAGQSLGEVTILLGVHYRSVQRWVAWYRCGGIALVCTRRSGGVGQPSFLSLETRAQVAREVATGRFRTGAEIREWIRQTYGIEYTVGGIYTLLKRLRGRQKVPRPIHPRTDLAQQEAWKKGDSAWPSLTPA
jgi:transposase